MIKYIDPKFIFNSKETKCYFKSISGGSIRHVIEDLKENEIRLKNVRIFVVTCGSNDLDSTYHDIQAVKTMYLELARTLKKLFPNARLVFNKLVRRTWTKYSTLEVRLETF
jgi:hypothetical protein